MMTLNGIFSEPRPHRINFIKENKRKLKQISSLVNQNTKCTKTNQAISQNSHIDIGKNLNKCPSKNISKQPSSGKLNKKSTITVFMQERKEDEDDEGTTVVPQKSLHKTVSVVRNQSCQTIDPKNYDQLFHEGKILYPSNKVLKELAEVEKNRANRLDIHVKKDFFIKNGLRSENSIKVANHVNPVEREKESQEVRKTEENKISEIADLSKSKECTVRINNKSKTKNLLTTFNAADIICKTTEDLLTYKTQNNQTSERLTPVNHGDSNSTQIPRLSKKAGNKKSAKNENEIVDPLCPPGHIPLPDQERKKTLHMLRVSYAELIREMNLLPVRTDTLRIRQRKMHLENQLSKIEEGIKVFNKSKVYVKIEK